MSSCTQSPLTGSTPLQIPTLPFFSCRELANQHTENLGTVLKHVIYNELSNVRNPNNMVLLSTLFQSNQEKAAKVCNFILFCYCISSTPFNLINLNILFRPFCIFLQLLAMVFQDLLTNK